MLGLLAAQMKFKSEKQGAEAKKPIWVDVGAFFYYSVKNMTLIFSDWRRHWVGCESIFIGDTTLNRSLDIISRPCLHFSQSIPFSPVFTSSTYPRRCLKSPVSVSNDWDGKISV